MRRLVAFLSLLTGVSPVTMFAAPSTLHPLGRALPTGELRFVIREVTTAGAKVMVESTYRPYRDRDVRKERHLHLIDSPFRSAHGGLLTVQREEFHQERHEAEISGTTARFAVPLRARERGFEAYQLAGIRVVSTRAGSITFERWFEAPPVLDARFGLDCSVDTLRGTFRNGGLPASPLEGALPLWPGLREIDVTFSGVTRPTVKVWDAMTKHHWDGWRQSVSQDNLSRRSSVARHISRPTVWRSHDYLATTLDGIPDQAAIPSAREAPFGVSLEVYWPDAAAIEFPDTHFELPVDVVALPVARLSPEALGTLRRSVVVEPGQERYCVSSTAWAELEGEAMAAGSLPFAATMKAAENGITVLELQRRDLTEPWLLIFGAEYDAGRRRAIVAVTLNPNAWQGPLPD